MGSEPARAGSDAAAEARAAAALQISDKNTNHTFVTMDLETTAAGTPYLLCRMDGPSISKYSC